MRRPLAALAAIAALGTATALQAGLLASSGGTGLLPRDISVCFVGDANLTRAAFITQIRDYLSIHQGTANIDYTFLAACPAPTRDASGNEVFGGTIRVLLAGTNVPYSPTPTATMIPIPGVGCTRGVPVATDVNGQPRRDASGNLIDSGASFALFPSDRSPANDSHCQWNLRLGNDGDAAGTLWRNHTLHEFGHQLGFAHEFERSDARDNTTAAGCTGAQQWIDGLPASGTGNTQFTSEGYDLQSTMNYTIPACPNYVGNYGHTGLSALEKLSLHFMYPEDRLVAEYEGTTVVAQGTPVSLVGQWEFRGASRSGFRMITSYQWLEGSTVLGTGAAVSIATPALGTRQLTLRYTDQWNRLYQAPVEIRVVPAAALRATHAERLVGSLVTVLGW
ncbi:MAG: hypothetical protein FJ206_11805 [Gemmatimonadetes bacterium]|nr:hypothetical protein [Gemmatimonadota bacterium]